MLDELVREKLRELEVERKTTGSLQVLYAGYELRIIIDKIPSVMEVNLPEEKVAQTENPEYTWGQ